VAGESAWAGRVTRRERGWVGQGGRVPHGGRATQGGRVTQAGRDERPDAYAEADQPPCVLEWARLWQAADKIVYVRTLAEALAARGRASSASSMPTPSGG
jgi:hypothetical protein